MKIYVVADLHMEHERMSTHCGRPPGFEQKILNAIGRTVRNDDLLINLGDFCWHRDAHWHEQYMLFALCKNWLTIGNHDGHNAIWYLSHGWHWAGESCLIEIQREKILFSHYPMPDTEEYTWNIHGHFHNTTREDQIEAEPEIVARLTNKHILVALEHTNYRPIELQTLIENHREKLKS